FENRHRRGFVVGGQGDDVAGRQEGGDVAACPDKVDGFGNAELLGKALQFRAFWSVADDDELRVGSRLANFSGAGEEQLVVLLGSQGGQNADDGRGRRDVELAAD